MRDQKVETLLGDCGVVYSYQSAIAVAEIDRERSLKNQARFTESLDPDLVGRYGRAMRRGADFPAIVVTKTKHGYLVLGGNHRTAAAVVAGRDTMDAYIVEPATPIHVQQVTWRLNYVEGKTNTLPEAINHAMLSVREHGVTMQVAARMFGVTKAQVERALSMDRHLNRLRRAGIEGGHGKVALDMLQSLSLIQTDPPFRAAFILTRDAKLTRDEMIAMRDGAMAYGTEGEQCAAIAAYAERPEIRNRLTTPIRQSEARGNTQVRRMVHGLTALIERHPMGSASLGFTFDELADMRAKLFVVVKWLSVDDTTPSARNGGATALATH